MSNAPPKTTASRRLDVATAVRAADLTLALTTQALRRMARGLQAFTRAYQVEALAARLNGAKVVAAK
jgi:hypothetical protein